MCHDVDDTCTRPSVPLFSSVVHFCCASCYHVGWMQVYEGQWHGQTVAIKVLDGAAAASQKAMKEVGSQTKAFARSAQLLD